MNWCCAIFEDLTTSAGKRGLSVVVARRNEAPLFFLQGRAIDAGAELSVRSPAPLVTLATQQGIAFCPGCGVRLAEHYSGDVKELMRNDLRLGVDN